MNFTSFFKSFSYPLHLTFGYIEDVCHLSSRLGLQAVDDQLFALWLNLWHVVRGQVDLHMKVWCVGVILYTPGNVLITVFVTGETLICDRLNNLKTRQDFCPSKI